MDIRNYWVNRTVAFVAVSLIVVANEGHANLLAFQGQYASELEEQAAISNQRVYDELKALGCSDIIDEELPNCSGGTFKVWSEVRELVHTANDLTNEIGAPTLFSLKADFEGLGFILRWTAGEEFSTQESMSDSFVNGQLTGLGARITALRHGVKGFSLASNYSIDVFADERFRWTGEDWSGGGASADSESVFSPWGGFINASYTYGDQDPSDFEDAFDFVGSAYSWGLDYRLNSTWVVGMTMGYSVQDIAFDASLSIVEGSVDMTAYSLMPFVLFQSDEIFASFSMGYQQAQFETDRFIRYPSFDPDTPSTDTIAVSDNDADIRTATGSFGYTYTPSRYPMVSIDPYLSVNYQHTSIDEYRELDIKNEAFAFIVEEQNLESLESVVGLRMQVVASFGWGVVVPFVDLQFYNEHNTNDHRIDAIYADAAGDLSRAAQFSLETNGTEQSYNIYGGGLSAVVRGTTYTTGRGAAGGIQVYVSYRTIENIQNYTQHIIAGGARYEF